MFGFTLRDPIEVVEGDSVDTIVGAEPEVAQVIVDEGVDLIGREAVLVGVLLESFIAESINPVSPCGEPNVS